MLAAALLVSPFIGQQMIQNCYLQNATLVYLRYNNEVLINITSTNNEECRVLSGNLEADLVIGDVMLRKILYEFDYTMETSISIYTEEANLEFEDCYLYLSNYIYQTQIPIFEAFRMEFSFDDCFDPVSEIILSINLIQITLQPTPECRYIIANYQIVGAELLVKDRIIFLDPNILESGYESSVIQFNITEDISELYSIVNTKSQLILSFTNFKIEYIFNKTEYRGIILSPDYQELYGQNLVVPNNEIFNVILTLEYSDSYRAAIGSLKFDHYLYSLFVLNSDNTNVSLQHTIYSSVFDEQLSMLEFRCADLEIDKKRQCNKIFSTLNEQTLAVLDLKFFESAGELAGEKFYLHFSGTHWSNVYAESKSKLICILFIKNLHEDTPKTFPTDNITELQLSLYKNGQLMEELVLSKAEFTYNEKQLCFPKTTFKNQNEELRGSVIYFEIIAERDHKQYKMGGVSEEVQFINKNVTAIIIHTFGTMSIILCMCISLYGIIDGLKTIRYAKMLER